MPFKKGGPPGPGRPKHSTEEKYLRAIAACVTAESWTRIVQKAMSQAEHGDNAARRWLTDYLIGQPVERQPDEKREIDEALLRKLDATWESGTPSGTSQAQNSGSPTSTKPAANS